MTTEERKNRIIARGEHSGHSHIAVGDCEVKRNKSGEVIIQVGEEGAFLKHLLESAWMEGNEIWTKEHSDVKLEPGTYKYIQQNEYDPYEDVIRQVRD